VREIAADLGRIEALAMALAKPALIHLGALGHVECLAVHAGHTQPGKLRTLKPFLHGLKAVWRAVEIDEESLELGARDHVS